MDFMGRKGARKGDVASTECLAYFSVPKGLIWWQDEKRHPLNRFVGRVVYRLRSRRGWSLQDLAEAAFAMVRGGLLRLTNYALRR